MKSDFRFLLDMKGSNIMPKGRRAKKKSKISIDLAAVTMIILSILVAVLIYTNSGYIGEHLSPTLGGIFGFVKYILPIGMFAIGIYLSLDDKDYLYSKLIQYAIFIVALSTIMSIFQITSGTIKVDQGFNEVIKKAYDLGTKNIGGGAIRNNSSISYC